MAKLATMSVKQLAEKMVHGLKNHLRLDDDQIIAASARLTLAWTRASYCHIDFDNDGNGKACETHDAQTFVQRIVAIDENLLDGLKQYESAGMTKFVLYSSPHGSILWAAAGRE